MTIFYAVVEGDPLDSGGKSQVIDGTSSSTIEGPDGQFRRQAYLGHHAYCDACGTAGPLVPAAGSTQSLRTYDTSLGAYQALGGDVVLCACARRPRVVAVYGTRVMIEDVARSHAVAAPASLAPVTAVSGGSGGVSARWFLVRDHTTGAPLPNRSFIAQVDGIEQTGTTDADGYGSVSAADEQWIEIHVVFSAPKRHLVPGGSA